MFAQAYMAENGFFQCFHSMGKNSCSWSQSFRHIAKALGGAAPRLFYPCTLGRTWGTVQEEGFVLFSHHGDADELHHLATQLDFRPASQILIDSSAPSNLIRPQNKPEPHIPTKPLHVIRPPRLVVQTKMQSLRKIRLLPREINR